jgi:hypothetical protein
VAYGLWMETGERIWWFFVGVTALLACGLIVVNLFLSRRRDPDKRDFDG